MPRHKRFKPIVKPRLNAKKEITSWFVDAGMINGRRVRFAFATKTQAQAKADEMKFAHREHGDSILKESIINHPEVAAALEPTTANGKNSPPSHRNFPHEPPSG